MNLREILTVESIFTVETSNDTNSTEEVILYHLTPTVLRQGFPVELYSTEHFRLDETYVTFYIMWSNLVFFGLIFSNVSLLLFRYWPLGVIPYLSLIYLNVSTYSKLKTIQVGLTIPTSSRLLSLDLQKEEQAGCLPSRARQQRKKELQLSQISLIIVAVFICCHSFKWIPNIYELRHSGQPEQDYDWPDLIRE